MSRERYQISRRAAHGPTPVLLVAASLFAPSASAQEAPASFGAQNGAVSAERFTAARRAFEEVETPASGLGMHFNDSSCAACHTAVGAAQLTGGSSAAAEIRAGFFGFGKRFYPAPGGTLITTRALGRATPEIEALDRGHNVRDRFITPSLFGAAFVEAVADDDLRRIARDQERHTDGRIRGFAHEVPVLEAPGVSAVGRFGWAAQHASLLSFAADAYRNEMGITSPLVPDDNTFLGNPADDGVKDPEDTGGTFGEDVELFVDFMRALSAPPRLEPADEREAERGSRVFESIGCDECHVPQLETVRAGEMLNGGIYRVPPAIGGKRFHPYGDYLLHDVGTGPSVLREELAEAAAGMVRTAALWGLGTRLKNGEPLLHDGSAKTLEDAIARHRNSAAREAESFRQLNDRDRDRLLQFLRSL